MIPVALLGSAVYMVRSSNYSSNTGTQYCFQSEILVGPTPAADKSVT